MKGGCKRGTTSAKGHIFASKISHDRYACLYGNDIRISKLHRKGSLSGGFMPQCLPMGAYGFNIFCIHTALFKKCLNRIGKKYAEQMVEYTDFLQCRFTVNDSKHTRFERFRERVRMSLQHFTFLCIDTTQHGIDTVQRRSRHETNIVLFFHKSHYSLKPLAAVWKDML